MKHKTHPTGGQVYRMAKAIHLRAEEAFNARNLLVAPTWEKESAKRQAVFLELGHFVEQVAQGSVSVRFPADRPWIGQGGLP